MTNALSKNAPKKIAILGGGPAALTAAVTITNEKNWQSKYDITIYQMGWRLGGKCATGRNAEKNQRIEEHGIHAFMGSYFNALTMMKSCYDELQRPKSVPINSFATAFRPQNSVLRWEFGGGVNKRWPLSFPANAADPATMDEKSLIAAVTEKGNATAWLLTMLEGGLGILMHNFFSGLKLAYQMKAPLDFTFSPGAPRPGFAGIVALIKNLSDTLKGAVLQGKLSVKVADAITEFCTEVAPLGKLLTQEDDRDRVRRMAVSLEYMAVLLRGSLVDKVATRGFKQIDDMDFVAWMRSHGASEAVLDSPMTLTAPNVSYQYPEGDASIQPTMAAGAYLQWSLRTFCYLGHFIYFFNAGTGDTIVAPIYELLKKRGVKFKFFHRVENLGVKGKKISHIDMTLQATLKDCEGEYQPLVNVKNLPCWPSTPDYSQLNEGDDIKKTIGDSAADLESPWCPWKGVGKLTLKQGEDFDQVVLGISVGALPAICKELADTSEPFKKMLATSSTAATQAMQIWLNETPHDLGWNHALPQSEPVISANFMMPMSGVADFSEYTKFENWPQNNEPAGCLYLCGMLPPIVPPAKRKGEDYVNQQYYAAQTASVQTLISGFGIMYPESTVAETKVGDPLSMNFSLLHMLKKGSKLKGVSRFQDQYWCANVNPSDSYVLTPPGSPEYRLRANNSGFSNLVLTGDWIDNSLNFGSVEASVMSGKQAGNAVLGKPLGEGVFAYTE